MKKIMVYTFNIKYQIINFIGTLWKHKEWRTGATGVRRSRRLVVSYFTTIANYDYGLYWYFFIDGTIKFEGIKFSLSQNI